MNTFSSIKNFFGVILDEKLNWNEHLNTIEKKVFTNIGILYKAKEIINRNSIYYSFIHIFLNYRNLSRGPAHLHKSQKRQKQASRIIVTLLEEQLKRCRSWKFRIFIKWTFTNLLYSFIELQATPYHQMCFMKGLRTLTISNKLGLVFAVLVALHSCLSGYSAQHKSCLLSRQPPFVYTANI